MASLEFSNLTNSVLELKRIYLGETHAVHAPDPDQQESARAFLVLAHAELEYFAEEAFRRLAEQSFAAFKVGNFGRAAIAALAFNGMEGLNGGALLSRGKKKIPRQLVTRFGQAHASVLQILDTNYGVREKHLAAMGIPLGLDPDIVDSTWLNELDAFCSFRGAYAHMSRTASRASPGSVNPHEVWEKCQRLIWTNARIGSPGQITSFESLDDWIEGQKADVAPFVAAPSWRLRVSHLLSLLIARRGRARAHDDDE